MINIVLIDMFSHMLSHFYACVKLLQGKCNLVKCSGSLRDPLLNTCTYFEEPMELTRVFQQWKHESFDLLDF